MLLRYNWWSFTGVGEPGIYCLSALKADHVLKIIFRCVIVVALEFGAESFYFMEVFNNNVKYFSSFLRLMDMENHLSNGGIIVKIEI